MHNDDGTIEYESDRQFIPELVRTGWDHMVTRRIAMGDSSVQSSSRAALPKASKAEIDRRAELLKNYKSATGNPSNMQIYQATLSGIHKPEFYEWLNGVLPIESATTQNFERFLAAKKRPIPRPKKSKK
jgi:hypothetical protein